MDTLAERLTKVRTKLGYNRKVFSLLIGIPESSYCHLEKGRQPNDIERLMPIVEKFNVNKRWLFGGKGEMFTGLAKKEESKEEQYILSAKELNAFFGLAERNRGKKEKVMKDFKTYLEIQKLIEQEIT